MQQGAEPIFVVGMNRSGTKWLSNLIANHPDVTAVQHEDHTGILETNAFDAWSSKFPDPGLGDDYVALAEAWVRADFFRITELPQDFFYRLDPRPRDAVEMFRQLMEAFTRRQGRARWLQKIGPWFAEEARRRFPNAHFVTIQRDREEVLRSSHFLVTEGKQPISVRSIASHHLQERILNDLDRAGAVPVTYGALRSDPHAELGRVCERIGLDFDPAMLELPWRKNTSFRSDEAKRFAFSPAERRRIRFVGALIEWCPQAVLGAARRAFPPHGMSTVHGTYRRLRRELDLP